MARAFTLHAGERMSKMDEMIIVAPRTEVFAGERLAFHGFQPLSAPRSDAILEGLCSRPYAARRGDVEHRTELLQPIPYVVVARTAEGRRELFTYTRLAGGGERRLHGRLSIGVGGHMNRAFDLRSLQEVIAEEAARELSEELNFLSGHGMHATPPPARLIGLINDDTGEVQRVHIGLLAIVEVPEDWRVEVRETDRLEGSWRSTEELGKEEARARLEEWSLHALAGLGVA